ncbi:hypothetical protein [Nostoc parmelioides]|uniref:Uncharacterized protein n=1 Tax=Nostoc parmelioides FACHB-3921 TaxID=2692909 RepID=A0ABR8BN63_9NOSO|nr:hypothetical protein [Nostoc parmelioides]MBD2254729.1 hypothetical protein [Nostoc parmelioides FACHB-3921]
MYETLHLFYLGLMAVKIGFCAVKIDFLATKNTSFVENEEKKSRFFGGKSGVFGD